MRCCSWFYYRIAVWNIGRIYLDVEFCLGTVMTVWQGMYSAACLDGAGGRSRPALYNPGGHMACLKEQGRTEENGIKPYALCR